MNERTLDFLDACRAAVHRRRWWIRLVLAVALVPWFGRFAYVRMTTLPANPEADSRDWLMREPDLAEGEPTKALLDAIAGTMESPALSAPTTAPAGMRWEPVGYAKNNQSGPIEFNLFEALSGPWRPQTRYIQGQVAAYIQDPRIEQSLERIVTLAGQPFRLNLPPMSTGSPFRHACRLLAVHARASMAERRDLPTAMRVMRAILDLCRKLQDQGVFMRQMVAVACRAVVMEEMMAWSREFRLTPREVRGLLDMLATYQPDMPRLWNEAVEADSAYGVSCFDAYYTNTPGGNGWLVIHPRETGDVAETIRAGANLLSPFLADRQTVLRKHHLVIQRAKLADGTPYQQAIRQLGKQPGTTPDSPRQINPADGPVLETRGYTYANMYNFLVRDVAMHAAAMTSMALSAYRTEHGHYPSALSDLVPAYIDALPQDPTSGGPLCYRLDERDGYSLYCVGEDGTDNGGILRDKKGELQTAWSGPDLIYPGIRPEMSDDYLLVPADEATTNSEDR